MKHVLPIDPKAVPKGELWRLRFEHDDFCNSFDLAYEKMSSGSAHAEVVAIMAQVDLGVTEMRWLRGLLDDAIAHCESALAKDENELEELKAAL